MSLVNFGCDRLCVSSKKQTAPKSHIMCHNSTKWC